MNYLLFGGGFKMNKYKVEYTKFNNNAWESQCGQVVVEASNEKEAKRKVENYSNYSYEYYVDRIEEVE